MASQWLQVDVKGGLYLIALLYQDSWTTKDPRVRMKVAAEIRIQEARFGLSNADRRRLGWEVAPAGASAGAPERQNARAARVPRRDPREALKVVG